MRAERRPDGPSWAHPPGSMGVTYSGLRVYWIDDWIFVRQWPFNPDLVRWELIPESRDHWQEVPRE